MLALRAAILPWMVAYDNNRYGRWLSNLWAMLTALPVDHVAYHRIYFKTPTPKWPGTCGVSVP